MVKSTQEQIRKAA